MYRDDEKYVGVKNDYYDQLKVLMKYPDVSDPLSPNDIIFEIVNDPSKEAMENESKVDNEVKKNSDEDDKKTEK